MLASGSPGLSRKNGLGLSWLDSITDTVDVNLRQTLEDSKGQGGLACCSPWGRKESDRTERRNSYHPPLGRPWGLGLTDCESPR